MEEKRDLTVVQWDNGARLTVYCELISLLFALCNSTGLTPLGSKCLAMTLLLTRHLTTHTQSDRHTFTLRTLAMSVDLVVA